MSPRTVRLLESSLVSAFVALGVSAAVFFGMPRADHTCAPAEQDPLLQAAVAADVAMMSDADLDDAAVARARALYTFYADEAERRAQMSDIEWARERAENLAQLEQDLATMRELEAEARALEAASN